MDTLLKDDKNIALIYPARLLYRSDLFKILSEQYGISVYFGNCPPQATQKYLEVNEDTLRHIKFFGLTFTLGLIRRIRKNNHRKVVMLGVNPLYISYLFASIVFKYLLGIKVIWWGHGSLGRQGRFGELLRLPFYSLAHRVLLYSALSTTDLGRYALGNKVVNIGNCNSLDSEYYGSFSETKNDSLKIVYIGRIAPRKKLDEFISLIPYINMTRRDKGLKEILLDVIGGPVPMDTLESNENVRYHGFLQPIDMKTILLQADMGICPGAVGLSVLHLAWHGLPVITLGKDVQHGPEFNYLVQGINAFFLEDLTLDEIIGLMEQAERSAVGTKSFKNSCRNSVLEFSNQKVAEKIIKGLWD